MARGLLWDHQPRHDLLPRHRHHGRRHQDARDGFLHRVRPSRRGSLSHVCSWSVKDSFVSACLIRTKFSFHFFLFFSFLSFSSISGGAFGQAIHMITGIDQGLAVACTMAGMQASITRTPLSSTLVVGFFFPQFVTTMMVPIAAATFTSYFLTTQNKLFAPQRQRGGTNLFCFSLCSLFFVSVLFFIFFLFFLSQILCTWIPLTLRWVTRRRKRRRRKGRRLGS